MAVLATAAPAWCAGYSDMTIDVNTGKVLHETNADELRYPASLTKMMTLYIVFDMLERKRLTLDTELSVSAYASAATPTKLGLAPGQTIRVEDAIKALVTASANDVARTIAENLGGSEEKFARYMTWQAHRLGMNDTTYRNASGLPDPGQMSTARDYITLSLHLYDDFPQYFSYFKTPYFTWGRARYRNHNGLLFNFPGTDGLKTGYIRAAGFNIANSVHRNGKHVIGVIFGGGSVGARNARMRALLTTALARSSSEHTRELPQKDAPLVAALPKKQQVPATVVKVAAMAPVATVAKPKAKTPAPVKLASASSGGDALAALIERTVPQVADAGDTSDASETGDDPASDTSDDPATEAPATQADAQDAPAQDAAVSAGPYQVQVGAYDTPAEAKRHLKSVLAAQGDLLTGHAPVAITYNAATKVWYRARFAGFDRSAADAACQILKAHKVDCMVMRAD